MNDKSASKKITIDDNKTDLLEKIFLTDFSEIQARIGMYDNHSLIIKGWAITLWSGLMYFIFKESVHELFIIQIIMLLIFWSLDALYKFFQRRLALRYGELQKYFEGYSLDIENGELKITYNKNNKSGLKIINQREDFLLDKKEIDERKALKRCILLRAVSVIYIYLISASFLTSVIIIERIEWFFLIPILVCSFIILSFGVYTYIFGIDDEIEKKKKHYLKYFYISFFSIATNLILLVVILFFS